MRSNAVACIHNTHKEEGSFTKNGGWTINPNDPGNWTGGRKGVGQLKGTKYGIAANTYPHLDIKNLTLEQADAIYIRDYWPKAWGDSWPEGFDQVTYDATVNSGPGRGPLWTCRALGYAKADRAATTKAQLLPVEDKVKAIKRATAIRLGFLRSLGTWGIFGKGWGGRVARMEAIGVKMALTAAKKPKAEVQKELSKESRKAGEAKAEGTVVGGGSTGTATVGAAKSGVFDNLDWLAVSAGVVLTIAAVWIVWKVVHNYHRQKAYIDAAKAA